MKGKIIRDIHSGKYIIRIFLEDFTDEEIAYNVRFGPIRITLPNVTYRPPNQGLHSGGLIVGLTELPRYEFEFDSAEEATKFSEGILLRLKQSVESFISTTDNFVGEVSFEIQAGEEIKKINEGARKALDRESKEYHEIIEKNREAWKKLSKL